MTDAEKNNITIPSSDNRGCTGFTGTVERLGFPGICLNDGPSGFRGESNGTSTGFPAQIHIGASWDRNLAYQRAKQLGIEFKAKGVNVFLGPVVGPLGRVVTGGRNWASGAIILDGIVSNIAAGRLLQRPIFSWSTCRPGHPRSAGECHRQC